MNRHAALALIVLVGRALAEPPQPPGDQVLRMLVAEALEARPELSQALAQTRAARERVPQAQAWPEPMLQVGVQNDSFTRWQVGTMETSWVSFMAAQTFPFPGKLELRGKIAESDVRMSELNADRIRLSTIAEVRRGYLALQLVRERAGLLRRLLELSARLVEVARIRLEAGAGPQSEALRAQVELSRLTQRKYLLEAEERIQLQALNRLRGQSLDTGISTATPLSSMPMPELLSEEQFLALARQRSPELLALEAALGRSQSATALSRRSYFPDLSVSVGVMLRGRLDPMWAINLGVPLPVFAAARQSRAVAEFEATADADRLGVARVEQVLALRARQRSASMAALRAVWTNYQDGLLLQANAAAESTTVQYEAGRATLSSVLEANAVSITEAEAALQVLAEAWGLAISQDELTLLDGGGLSAPRANAKTTAAAGSGM